MLTMPQSYTRDAKRRRDDLYLQDIEQDRERNTREEQMGGEAWRNHIASGDGYFPETPSNYPGRGFRTRSARRRGEPASELPVEGDDLLGRLALLDVCTSVESCKVIITKLKINIMNSIPSDERRQTLSEVAYVFLQNTKRIDSLKDRVDKAKNELSAEIVIFRSALADHLTMKARGPTRGPTTNTFYDFDSIPPIPTNHSKLPEKSNCTSLVTCQKEIDDLTLLMKGRLADPDSDVPIGPAMRLKEKVEKLNALWREYVNVDATQDELMIEMKKATDRMPNFTSRSSNGK